ncbi:lytic murein transglycosylase [Roseibacterium sp. SDUM158017]|uniref:lytic murein transglycosylase n=1 Tax=Roseicyclus salinarum TaxID=3036773 RepID=UPI002415633B|nr:lytic murein transglycosylase [Roseibacterium sp. SDUM158017]MDG4647060.1 lytic murein transglycosylase [Roseibacterium sp. SDUM158017]
MKTGIIAGLVALGVLAGPVAAQQCGGDFGRFVQDLRAEALSRGHPQAAVDAFFTHAGYSQRAIDADRRQGIFTVPFTEFARRLISQNRIDNGRANAQRYASVFDAIEQRFGVSRGILLSFWAFETDYGAFQGDYNTLDALVTLAHDCRRPHIFRPQVFAALELFRAGDFDPVNTQGAWAGEIGMVQMLPEDIVAHGIDGDGDGHVYLQTSAPDALMSGANVLSSLGWRPNEPWLVEIVVPPDLDWYRTGIHTSARVSDWEQAGVRARSGGSLPMPGAQASVVLPQGRNGPAFLAYPNFSVLFEWNQSFTYVLTAAYFANRLEGAPVFDAGNPDPGLEGNAMRELQRRLAARGHDVGAIDGILGAGTRAAVREEQRRLGLPADAWPTQTLLNAL